MHESNTPIRVYKNGLEEPTLRNYVPHALRDQWENACLLKQGLIVYKRPILINLDIPQHVLDVNTISVNRSWNLFIYGL